MAGGVTRDRVPAKDTIPADRLLDAFAAMVTVRAFEEAAAAGYRSGEMPGAVHVSIGQEAISGALAVVMGGDDALFSTHRGHGHCIARGVELRRLFAELLARRDGCSGGRGGSMHLFSAEQGVLGTNGIVGPNISLAVGHALARKVRSAPGATVALFGDGAAGTGIFHESLQLASLWRVPVVLICENNSFSEFTPFEDWATFANVRSLAERYNGVEVFSCDGTSLLATISTLDRAFAAAKAGVPAFVEASAPRLRGHYEGDAQKYRREDTESVGGPTDPINLVRREVVKAGVAEADLERIAERRVAAVAQALEAARGGDPPDPSTVRDEVYAA